MTGGLAIILGSIGFNFAAGMTGGLAFVYDETGRAAVRINRQMVNVEPLGPEDAIGLQMWLQRHVQLTGSAKAQSILNDWANAAQRFLKISPKDLPSQTIPAAPQMVSTVEAM
jgi:glutamate synthase domain-containing protein 3